MMMQDGEGPGDLPPRPAAASGPSDEDLESAIVEALKMGLRSVAETLGEQLRVRQAAAPMLRLVK